MASTGGDAGSGMDDWPACPNSSWTQNPSTGKCYQVPDLAAFGTQPNCQRAACAPLNASLACITSENENSWLYETFCGASYQCHVGRYKLTEGCVEMDGYAVVEDSLEQNYRWVARECASERPCGCLSTAAPCRASTAKRRPSANN